jgi:hypothetical protein
MVTTSFFSSFRLAMQRMTSGNASDSLRLVNSKLSLWRLDAVEKGCWKKVRSMRRSRNDSRSWFSVLDEDVVVELLDVSFYSKRKKELR